MLSSSSRSRFGRATLLYLHTGQQRPAGGGTGDRSHIRTRIRSGHGTENMAVLRHIAINLLQQDKTTKARIQTERLKRVRQQIYG